MIKNIQALRALAAMIVVVGHLGDFTMGAGNFIIHGGRGVDLFFMISGFVMVYTTRENPPSSFMFFRNRIVRIVPIYWAFTVAVFAVAASSPGLLGSTRANAGELVKSMLFIPFIKSSGLYQPMLFVGWSLNYEMLFYALFAVFLLLPNYKSGLICTALALLTIAIGGMYVPGPGIWHDFYGDPRMLEFMIGMAIPYIVDRVPPTSTTLRKALILASLAAFPLLLYLQDWMTRWQDVSISATASFVLLTSAIVLERDGLVYASPGVVLLGDASYSMYLLHPFIAQPIQRIVLVSTQSPIVLFAMAALSIGAIVAGSVISYMAFERPMLRWTKRMLIKRWSPVVSASRH